MNGVGWLDGVLIVVEAETASVGSIPEGRFGMVVVLSEVCDVPSKESIQRFHAVCNN